MGSKKVPDLVPAQILSLSELAFSRYPDFIQGAKKIHIGVIRVSP